MTASAQDALRIRGVADAAAAHAKRIFGGHVGLIIAERCRDVLTMPWLGESAGWRALVDDVMARRPVSDELAAYADSLDELAAMDITPLEQRPGLARAAAYLRMADTIPPVIPTQRVRVEVYPTKSLA